MTSRSRYQFPLLLLHKRIPTSYVSYSIEDRFSGPRIRVWNWGPPGCRLSSYHNGPMCLVLLGWTSKIILRDRNFFFFFRTEKIKKPRLSFTEQLSLDSRIKVDLTPYPFSSTTIYPDEGSFWWVEVHFFGIQSLGSYRSLRLLKDQGRVDESRLLTKVGLPPPNPLRNQQDPVPRRNDPNFHPATKTHTIGVRF